MRNHNPKCKGFTLLELLTVLVIVAVLAGVLVMNYTGSSETRTLNTHAERFMLLVELARQKSTLNNEVWGVSVLTDSYVFMKYSTTGEWISREESPFSASVLQDDYAFRFRALGTAAKSGKGSAGAHPDLIIYPSGEVTPFEVTLLQSSGNQARFIFSDGIQRTVVSQEPYRPAIKIDET